MKWLRVQQAAKYANVGKQTIYDWITNGLNAYKPGKKVILIKSTDIDKYISRYSIHKVTADEILKEVYL